MRESAPTATPRTIVGARLVVYPKAAGDFGFMFVSGVTRSDREWKTLMEDMKRGAERHLDGVYSAVIEYEYAEEA